VSIFSIAALASSSASTDMAFGLEIRTVASFSRNTAKLAHSAFGRKRKRRT
jgi:hypothetical protein